MASNIDPTKPEAGQATTQSVRDNFQAAADEITTLQDGEFAGGITAVSGLFSGGASDAPLQTSSSDPANYFILADDEDGTPASVTVQSSSGAMSLRTGGTGINDIGTEAMSISATQRIEMPLLPTSDPGIPGTLWNDAGTVKVSL